MSQGRDPARPRCARAPGSARPLVHRPNDKPKIANARLTASTSVADYARIIRLANRSRAAAHAASPPTIPGTNEPAIRGGKRRHEPEPTPKRKSAPTISREHVRTRAAESMCTDELPGRQDEPKRTRERSQPMPSLARANPPACTSEPESRSDPREIAERTQAPCRAGDRRRPAQLVSLNSSRPISMRRISLVPAPISYSFASRSSRPVG